MVSSAVRALRGVLRLEPFETLSMEGRSRERYRRVALSTVAAAGARAITIATGLVTVPLAVRYLGTEQYGLYVTITSLAALLAWADLGISNGLVSSLSATAASRDRRAVRELVSSAFFMLVCCSLVAGALFAAFGRLIPWSDVFNVSSTAAVEEAGPAVAVFAVFFLVSLPLGVAQRVQMGLQESFHASLWTGLGALLGLAALIVAIELEAGLPVLVAALAGGPAVALLLNNAVLYWRREPELRPTPRAFRSAAGFRLLQTGLLFLVLQIAMAVAYESDALVLAQILGTEAVTTFSVAFKLFMIAPILLSFAFAPLWPAYADAHARQDTEWIRLTLKRTLLLSVAVTVPLSAFLVVFGQPIVHLWVGDMVTPSLSLLLALGAWVVIVGISGALAAFLNGVNAIRFQAVCAAAMMVANIALSIVLTKSIGISGVVLGSIVAQTVFVLVPCAVVVRRRLHRGQGASS